jgi:hypothetical protein
MSAPHITGLAALVRSVNPLLTQYQIRSIITSNSDHRNAQDPLWGNGLPNAAAALDAALATSNRLTPLFAFFGQDTKNYFYTTVPQMGAAANAGTLRPYVAWDWGISRYDSVGTTVSEYPNFPAQSYPGEPRAQVWVFTTAINPIDGTLPLLPLYRLSNKCGDSSPVAVCSTYPYHVDHTYVTNIPDAQTFVNQGYKYDGLEGYVYPKTATAPRAGMVKLIRKYNAQLDDHAIFPETETASMAAAGYTQDSVGDSWMGWVFINSGSRPTY